MRAGFALNNNVSVKPLTSNNYLIIQSPGLLIIMHLPVCLFVSLKSLAQS